MLVVKSHWKVVCDDRCPGGSCDLDCSAQGAAKAPAPEFRGSQVTGQGGRSGENYELSSLSL